MSNLEHVPGHRKRAWLGAVLVIGAGWLGLAPLAPRSFDWLFLLRPDVPVDEVALVYMDDPSHDALVQPSVEKWDRGLHAQLIERLAGAGARAAVFDVWFQGRTTNDAALLKAVALATNSDTAVVFAGVVLSESIGGRRAVDRAMPPFVTTNPPAADATGLPPIEDAVPWGLVQAGSRERVRREHYRPHVTERLAEPTLAWRVATLTLTNSPTDPHAPRWLNFYGPPGHLKSHSYHRALEPGSIPGEMFSNRVVFIGANARLGHTAGSGTDHFDSPYLGSSQYPGVDLNATAYLNLARGDWLERLPTWLEILLVVTAGVALAGLDRVPARRLVLVALAAVAVVTMAAWAGTWWGHRWFSWLAIAGVQVPTALAWTWMGRPQQRPGESSRAAWPGAQEPNDIVVHPGSLKEERTAVAAPSPLNHTPSIPDHELLKLVGTGAYGEIWLARNAIGTFHAVKLIRRASFDSNEPYEREFRGLQKFMPISRSHPGLVHILHVGRNNDAGLIYYVMEVADDETRGQHIEPNGYSPRNLSRVLRDRGHLGAPECLELAIPLATALGHLHAQRLVHRDIKPANIIFVGGAAKLADVGLVTEAGSPGRETSFVGTEGYIPPEGPGHPGGDVFALGLVLYQALTGLPRARFPALPDDALQRPDSSLLLDLNDVILKACAPDPNSRYVDGKALLAGLVSLRG